MRSKLKFGFALMILILAIAMAFARPKPDDCWVAYEIAYQSAFDFCMANIGEEGTCKYQACNEANRHAADIGCPPMTCP